MSRKQSLQVPAGAAIVLSLAFTLGACSGWSPEARSTAIGATAGAAIGGVVTGSTTGAAVGAAAGAVVGNQVEKNKK